MKKKMPITLLLVILLVAMIAGCASPSPSATTATASPAPAADTTDTADTAEEEATAEEAAEEADREHASLTMLRMTAASTTVDPWRDTPVGQLLAERTNVELDIEFLVGSDQRQKASLLIAAGEYPDIMETGDASGDFYGADAFVPLNDYLDTYTNLGACFTDSKKKLMTQEDGNIYWLGGQPSENSVFPAAGYYLNMDLLAQNDYPVVTDFQVWQDMILEYVKNNPTTNGMPTIGISEPTEAWRASAVQYGGSRFLVGFQNDGLTVVDPATLECKVIMDQDFQKQFVQMMFRMWNEGAADLEMFMQTDEQYQAKIGSGRIAGLYDQRAMIQNGLDALAANDPSRMLVAFPVTLPGVTTERYRGPRNFSGGSGLGITVSAENPDRVAQFFDDLAKEENQIVLRWGVEGTDWSFGSDGKLTKDDAQWADYGVPEKRQASGIGQLGWFGFFPGLEVLPGCNTVATPDNTPEFAQIAYKDYEMEFLANMGAETFVDWFNPSYDAMYEPGWSIRQRIDTNDERKQAGEAALEITLEYIPKLVQAGTEEKFESIWEEFAGILAGLPLRAYEELATQMIKDGAELYKN